MLGQQIELFKAGRSVLPNGNFNRQHAAKWKAADDLNPRIEISHWTLLAINFIFGSIDYPWIYN